MTCRCIALLLILLAGCHEPPTPSAHPPEPPLADVPSNEPWRALYEPPEVKMAPYLDRQERVAEARMRAGECSPEDGIGMLYSDEVVCYHSISIGFDNTCSDVNLCSKGTK
jgi:hypothetical protein